MAVLDLISEFTQVDKLSPPDFELFVRDLFVASGWSDATVTSVGSEYRHGDGGVDIFAFRGKKKFAIEVKQRQINTTVDVSALNQLVTGAKLANVNNLILVTNSYFTSEVKVRALRLGVELIDRDSLQNLYILKHTEIGRDIKPRGYQKTVIDECLNKYKDGANKFLIEMATGLGKTYTVALIVKRVLTDSPNKKIRVLFLAHQIEILLQSVTSFKNVLGIGSYSYSACFGGSSPEDTDFVFASFDTLYSKLNELKNTEFDIVIVDEAHHTPAKTYGEVVEHFKPSILIGLTATPERMDSKDVLDFFGGSKGHIGKYDLAWGLKNNKLAFPKYSVLLHDLDQGRIEQIEKGLTVDDLDKKLFLNKKDEEIVRIVEEAIIEKNIQNPKGIIFCNSIKHMMHLINFFEMGTATLVHSKMTDLERRNNIREFREGRFKYILVCDLFNEGIDIPETNILVFMRYTGSRTIWLQQLGRGLRKTANKEYVYVFDFVGSLERLADVKALVSAVKKAPIDKTVDDEGNDGVAPKGIIYDNTLEVNYSQSAAQVLTLIEDLEYRLNSRSNLIDAIRDAYANTSSIPKINELEEQLPNITLDQISTHFDSYYRYLLVAFDDAIDPNEHSSILKNTINEYLNKNSVEPSVRALVNIFKFNSLEFYSEADVTELVGPYLNGSIADTIQPNEKQSPIDVHHVSNDEQQTQPLITKYKNVIRSIDDLKSLPVEERNQIKEVFKSEIKFLKMLGVDV